MSERTIIGIDPGKAGGIAILTESNNQVVDIELRKMPTTDHSTYLALAPYFRDTFLNVKDHDYGRVIACLEYIRPGFKGTNKVSMAELYGSYRALRMLLISLGFVNEKLIEVTATRWHRWFAIEPRRSGESTTQWKGRLKDNAQRRFPDIRLTLNTCDALLIAEYARMRTR